VRSFVYLQVFGPGEDLAAAGKRAGERLFSGVDPDVVDKFVLCLEGPAIARASLPTTGVCGALRTPDMLHGEVGHYLVHTPKVLPALLPGKRLLGFDPLALHLLLHGLPHVAEEGSVGRKRTVGQTPYVVRHGELRRRLRVVVRLASPLHAQPHLVVVMMMMGVEVVSLMMALVLMQRRREDDPSFGSGSLRHKLVPPEKKVPGRISRMRVQMRMVGVGLRVGQRMMSVRVMMMLTLRRRHLQSEARQVSMRTLHEGIHHEIVIMIV